MSLTLSIYLFARSESRKKISKSLTGRLRRFLKALEKSGYLWKQPIETHVLAGLGLANVAQGNFFVVHLSWHGMTLNVFAIWLVPLPSFASTSKIQAAGALKAVNAARILPRRLILMRYPHRLNEPAHPRHPILLHTEDPRRSTLRWVYHLFPVFQRLQWLFPLEKSCFPLLAQEELVRGEATVALEVNVDRRAACRFIGKAYHFGGPMLSA